MGIKYIIDNLDGSLPQQVINGSLSATTFYGDGSGLSGVTVTPAYKVYTALLTQTGTSAPTAVVLENTLGFEPTWLYSSTGLYSTTNPIFQNNKTTVNIFQNINGYSYLFYGYIIGNIIYIGSVFLFSNIAQNNLLTNTGIEIRVYN